MNNSGKKKFIIDKYKIAMSNHEIFEELSLKDKIDADDRIWEEFKNQLLDKIPKKLYKYQTISKNHYNSLINDEAYFSSPNKFNDTYDFTINFDLEEEIDYFDNNKEACLKDYCLTFFKYISDYYKINVDTSEIDKVIIIYKDGRFNEKSAREYLLSKTDRENANKIIKYVKNANRNLLTSEFKKTIKGYVKNFINTNKKIREETKILCLSEDCNNDMMWGKYTNESKGYCLEYSFEVKKKDEVLVTNIYPIYYGKKPKISLEDILKKSVFNENEIKYSGICLSDWLQMNLCLFTKKKEWENEKEWRIVLDSSYKNNLQKMPYLTSIILGERISKQNKNKLLKIAKEKNIDVYERKINITCSDVIVNKIYEARKY